jgi:hypothetical protein
MSKLFTKEFLDELQAVCDKFTIIDYIMHSKNKNFHEAILDLAKYAELKPKYIIKKDK